MREQIVAALIRRDEAEALGIIEPLDRTCLTCRHVITSLKKMRDNARSAPETKKDVTEESPTEEARKRAQEKRPTITTT
jgi:hypothetical protein